jgi:hypothetical protein
MITYPVDVANTRWAILYLPTGEIVARNRTWPRGDGEALVGADPDYVYLLQVGFTQPDYDGRIYTLQSVETINAAANTLTKAYATVKRPAAEIVEFAETEEAARLTGLVDIGRELVETRLMLAAVLSYIINGETPPAKVRAYAQAYIAKGVDLWANRNRLEQIITAINANTDFDIDGGWRGQAG